MEYRILLVEDEELIGEMVKFNLEEEGYDTTWLTNGSRVLPTVRQRPFDLIVLDVMLPEKNGFEVAADLRAAEVGTPILMLTARSETAAKVRGLDAGADDYLTKPFEMEEFLARVRALIRRSQTGSELHSSRLVRIGTFNVNLETRLAESNEGDITLSEKEALLLELFTRNAGKTLTRADILDEVWGMDATPTERTVDNYIVRLRKLFEQTPETPRHFLTMRAHGYSYQP